MFPFGWVPRIRVRLTTLGRAAARAGKGITTPVSPPRGLMARWSFAALARLYVAGERGLHIGPTSDRVDEAPSWNTLLHLRDRREGSLIYEFEHRVRLSDLGRGHYSVHHACYRELYPDIDAPSPAEQPDGAHAGLADHGVRPSGAP